MLMVKFISIGTHTNFSGRFGILNHVEVGSRVVDELFPALDLDQAEWVENIQKGECSLKGFLYAVGESIDERESRQFKEGLDSKVKLSLYRTFCKVVDFKAYLHGECDAGSRLMFKFRSCTHGLNKEFGTEGRGERSAYCVIMNVTALVMFCGIVQSTVL